MKPSTVIIRDGGASGEDVVQGYATYALATGLADDEGAAAIDAAAAESVAAIGDERWNDTTALMTQTFATYVNASHGVNFYYILDPLPFWPFGEPGVFGEMTLKGFVT